MGSTTPSKPAKAGADGSMGLLDSHAANSQQTTTQPSSSPAPIEAVVNVVDAAPRKSSEPGNAAPMDIDRLGNMNAAPQAGRSGVSSPPQAATVSTEAAAASTGQDRPSEHLAAGSLSPTEPGVPSKKQLQPVTPSPVLPARGLNTTPITPALEHISGEPSNSPQDSSAGRQMLGRRSHDETPAVF